MQRFLDLFSTLQSRFPQNDYLAQLLAEARKRRTYFGDIRTYSRALESLDAASWTLLRTKAIDRFRENPSERGQAQLFDVLNEAIAYRFLRRHGCESVRCLPESKGRGAQKTPDIAFRQNHTERRCEVKTLHQSDHEFRRIKLASYNARVYARLPTRFLDGKLNTVLQYATEQLGDYRDGLVFLVIHFDDIGQFHRSHYRLQLHEYFAHRWPNLEIYAQFGVSGLYMHHAGNGFEAAV